MTRINTNVASLRGQRSMAKSDKMLASAMTRLSTGVKINNGKDDPSGLIAGETMRSQISTIEKSITNSNRANNVLTTADGALGEIGGLLTQVRGLVQEGLNDGALSQEERDANQLQIDNALTAINRISSNTTFAGDKLLDGSKAFTTQVSSTDKAKLSSFSVNQALPGAGGGELSLNAQVTTAAQKAGLQYNGGEIAGPTVLEVQGSNGREVLEFGAGAGKTDIRDAINALSDATGVTAKVLSGGELSIAATEATEAVPPTPATASSLTIGADDAALSFTRSDLGAESGFTGSINVEIVDAAAGSDSANAVSVAKSGDDFTLTITRGYDQTGGPAQLDFTAADVVTAIDGLASNADNDEFKSLVNYEAGGDGSGNIAPAASAALAGGSDEVPAVPATASTLSLGAGDAGLDFERLVAGAESSFTGSINIEIVEAASGSDSANAVAVSKDGDDFTLTITKGYDSSGADAQREFTAADVVTAIDSLASNTDNDAFKAAVSYAVNADGDGSGDVAAVASTALAGGTDAIATDPAVAATDVASLKLNDVRKDTSAFDLSFSIANTAGLTDNTVSIAYDDTTGEIAIEAGDAATVDDVLAAIDASEDLDGVVQGLATGDSANALVGTAAATTLEADGGALVLESNKYGSDEVVAVNVLEGSFSTTTAADPSVEADRDAGTDIEATINGQRAIGRGLSASVKTSMLDASVTFETASNEADTTASINITGGGAVFQIGQDVSVTGQIGIGIDAVNTARLGSETGKLYELTSGGGKSLNDVKNGSASGADLVSILDGALNEVSSLRGRIGAVQKNVIDTNINTLGVALENISEARSQIVDTDFAVESANLQKAQILGQAATSVLSIANQSPQRALSLLG